ncbi:MAG TPA: transcription antitermination factor NusB [Gemmatimonadales bacterium]|nr:transcription antitermination factor NusB [Gemmatimonadales bacterium]
MALDGLAARRAALRMLAQVRDGRPFDAALDRVAPGLADADRRLAHELAAGVLRARRELDAQLAPHVTRGWAKVPAPLQDVLRLGAYQLTALDRVPAHAAVDTSVRLAREVGGTKAGGFVNAVLRKVAGEAAPDRPRPPATALDRPSTLAERHSHPDWLVRRWVERFGDAETERLLAWNNTRPQLVLQPARARADALLERWQAAGLAVRPAPFGAGLVTEARRPADVPGYAEGAFVVQDPAQALLAWYADLPPDALVYDACAAPGGKTIGLGRCGARVVAADVSRARVRRLRENLQRAGSGREHVVVADALHPPLRARDVPVVLLDAPCLGTGTFARHPDARWRVTPEALAELAARQAALLDEAAHAVAPGGLLVYATCSIEPEEDEQQVDAFLARHPEFRREPPEDFPASLLSAQGDLVVLPQRHRMDGAFAARLRRADLTAEPPTPESDS